MPEVNPRPPSPEDEEAKGTPRADGETPKSSAARAKEDKEQKAREKEERDQRRRRDLEREKREAAESQRTTVEAARKAAKALKEAVVAKKVQEPLTLREIQEHKPQVISTAKKLESYPREQVIKFFAERNIRIKVPEQWDSYTQAQKEDFFAENKIINEVESEIGEKEIGGKKYLVWKKDEKNFDIYGLGRNLEKKEVEAFLKELGVKEKLPRDWNKHDYPDRYDWLKARGVRTLGVVVSVEGEKVLYDVPADITSKQVEKILEAKPPKDWAAMSSYQRREWYLKSHFLPAMSGAGTEVPEWSDVPVPNPNYTNTRPVAPDNQSHVPNREANIRQDLGTVVSRRLELMRRTLVVNAPGSDWTELGDRLDTLVKEILATTPEKYRFARMQIDQTEKIYRAFEVTGSLAEFDTAMNPAVRTQLTAHLNAMNTTFRNMYNTDPRIPRGAARGPLFGELDQLAADNLGATKGGWRTEEQAEKDLIAKVQEVRHLEPAWAKGILDWYVYEVRMPHVRAILEEYRDLTAITDPDEFERAIVRGIRKAESTNLSSADLNAYYQRILGLVTEFPARNIREIEMRNYLSAEIQASLLVNQIFIVVENGEAHPEKLLPLFEQIKNIHATQGINTWQVFFRRFRMTYSNGSPIEDDTKNPIYRDPNTREAYDFNLESDIINIIHYQLQGERLLFDEIQNAQRILQETGRNLFVDPAFRAMFTAVGLEPPPDPEEVRRTNEATGRNILYRTHLEAWQKHNTLVGASGEVYADIDPVTGRRTIIPDPNLTYVDFWDRRMIDRVRTHLINVRGMTPQQVDNMPVMIRAAYLNATRFIQAFGWSEYDGIEAQYQNGRPNFTVFGPRTPFFNRAIDNTFRHFRNEYRGQIPRTNQIFEEEFYLGYMLPTVRVLVRFTENLYLNQAALAPGNPDVSPILNDVAGFNARWGLGLPAGTTIRQAYEAVVPIIQERSGYNFANSSGVAVAEMIDHGNITFGRQALTPADAPNLINWEEEVRDITRFDFTDLYGDRATALKMYDRGALQELFRNPTFENLMKVYGELFYSGRNIRLWDNMEQALRAFHRIQQEAPAWFHHQEKGSAFETYASIKSAVQAGRLDPGNEERTMRALLGIWLIPGRLRIPGVGPVRWTRMWADWGYFVGKRNYNPAAIAGHLLSALWQFITEIFKQSAQQLGAPAGR